MSRSLPQLLDRHREELAACRRCGHDDPAVLPILSEARTPRIMLVGQAPGKVELADRRPFAGRAGRTLFRWLERAGLDEATARRHLYIAAITRCYPGPSPAGRGDRVPSPRERALCATWLDGELSLIKPALIIPVGRLAIDRFLGARPLDAVVGRELESAGAWGGARVVALPHPSGASSWLNAPEHRILVDRALELLSRWLVRLRIVRSHGTRRSA
ncbi:MAG TPA: uracil-DNA glycosylase family protein [Gemmatimonadaceae bacterium]|nr:uracil-DNA glycosylase family protein [Gemmatimonadaceae bacterium]